MTVNKPTKIILGIDPGTVLMGYCILVVADGKPQMKVMDVLKLNAKKDNHMRLHVIFSKVEELIRQFKPECIAIEAPFFGKNVQSMLKLGRAQGVAIAAALSAGLEVIEYSPRKIKQSITGNGNAGKEQVWKMLQQILMLPESDPLHYDASDALAVAVCHHFQGYPVSKTAGSKKIKDWKGFLAMNPERVIR